MSFPEDNFRKIDQPKQFFQPIMNEDYIGRIGESQ